MNAVQLDECISSKKLVKICTQEGKISTVPFPSAIGGKGIIVISAGGMAALDLPKMISVLAAFKQALPQWPELNIDHAIIELWADSPTHDVTVCRVWNGLVQWHLDFAYTDIDWPMSFLTAIEKAARF